MAKDSKQHNSAQPSRNQYKRPEPEANFHATSPAHVRYCKTLEFGARLMYVEIMALTKTEGYCWASNSFFAQKYGVSTRSVRTWIKQLADHGFIEIEINRHDQSSQRKIWPSQEIKKMCTVGSTVPTPPIKKALDKMPSQSMSDRRKQASYPSEADFLPYNTNTNPKASKLASHPSDLPSGNHKPEEEDDEDYGFPDPDPEEIPISREDADSNYHKLRNTYKLCHEDAKFLAIRYRGPEIKAQLNNMERQISQGIKITKPGKWIRGVLEQECGKRSPCSQLKGRKL